jgi:uncharacterized protein (TIGR03086 family)
MITDEARKHLEDPMSEQQEPSQIPDPRPWYARSREQMAALIDEVRPEHLDNPTPCAEYDVRALLAHIVGACDRWALLGQGGDGLALEPMATGVPDDAWPAAYDEASGHVADAWAPDARMDAAVTVPWGTAPGRIALTGYIMETATHTWDLARALGVDTEKGSTRTWPASSSDSRARPCPRSAAARTSRSPRCAPPTTRPRRTTDWPPG